MKHLPVKECGYAVLFLLTLAFVYFGTYLLIVEPDDLFPYTIIEGLVIDEIPHGYRFGGDTAAWLFRPAHQFDKSIRPDRWRNANASMSLSVTPSIDIGGYESCGISAWELRGPYHEAEIGARAPHS